MIHTISRTARAPLVAVIAASTLAPLSPAAASPPSRTVTVDRGAQDPAVSPDGRRIAVSILGKIFIVPIEGGAAQPLSEGLGWDRHPAWSPDGRFLAYAHRLPSGAHLVVRDLEGGTTRFIHHVDGGIGQIAFHPEGNELFFVLERNQYDAHLWRVPLSGGGAEQLTHTDGWHEWSFALSPEGDRVFFESGRYGGADLYLMRLPGREVDRLTRTSAKEYAVAWARDGRRIYLAQQDGVDRLMVQQADGGSPRAVFASSYDGKTLALTPDGSAAILAAGRRLHRVDLVTGASTPIPFSARFTLPERAAGDLVVTNARVFTGTTNEYLPDATVVVRNGRIASVRSGAGALPADVPVLDAGGRVLMSGLTDNHWHYWSAFDGGALLARGVTAVRDPGAAISESLNFKDAIALGLLPGPHLYTAGPLIDGPGGYHPMVDVALERPEAAAPLVRALKAQGVDALKVYFLLDPQVAAAVVAEARAQGLPVTGHVGVRTSWSEALQAGIHGFSHVRVWKDFLPPESQPQGGDESLDSRKWPVARMQADWSRIDPDGPAATGLIRQLAASGVAVDPTLAVHRIGEDHRRRLSVEQFQIARDSYRKVQRFVRRAHEAGVPILAGTDNVSIFDEVEAYAEAGIPNAAILRAATVNGAVWLGREADFGTVEPGRRADLILVDGDPLREIADLRKITTVIQDGRVVVRR